MHPLLPAFTALAAVHPLLPWAVLALLAFGVDKILDATGLTARIRAAVPFGDKVAVALDRLPAVIFGAAVAAMAGGDAAMAHAVWGAVSAVTMPVLLAARKYLSQLLGAAVLLAGIAGPSACLPHGPVEYTPEEATCIVAQKALTAEAIAKCGKRVDGECSTDAIYAEEEARVFARCLPE